MKIKSFGSEVMEKLSDVRFCKCTDYTTCRYKRDKKVPIEEMDLLTDQRNEKRMVIGGVDYKITKKI